MEFPTLVRQSCQGLRSFDRGDPNVVSAGTARISPKCATESITLAFHNALKSPHCSASRSICHSFLIVPMPYHHRTRDEGILACS